MHRHNAVATVADALAVVDGLANSRTHSHIGCRMGSAHVMVNKRGVSVL